VKVGEFKHAEDTAWKQIRPEPRNYGNVLSLKAFISVVILTAVLYLAITSVQSIHPTSVWGDP